MSEYVLASLAAILLGIVVAITLFYRPDVVFKVSSVLIGLFMGFVMGRIVKYQVVTRISRK